MARTVHFIKSSRTINGQTGVTPNTIANQQSDTDNVESNLPSNSAAVSNSPKTDESVQGKPFPIGEAENIKDKNKVAQLLEEIIHFESNKNYAPIAQQLEENIVKQLEAENISLHEKVKVFEVLENENIELKIQMESLKTEMELTKNKVDQQHLAISILEEKLRRTNESLKALNNHAGELYTDKLEQEAWIQCLEFKANKLHQPIQQQLQSRVEENVNHSLGTSLASNNNGSSLNDSVLSSRRHRKKCQKFNISLEEKLRIFVCTDCGNDFSREQDLKFHKKRIHYKNCMKRKSVEEIKNIYIGVQPKEPRNSESFFPVTNSSSGLRTFLPARLDNDEPCQSYPVDSEPRRPKCSFQAVAYSIFNQSSEKISK